MKKDVLALMLVSIALVCLAAFPRAIEVVNGNFLFGYDQGKHWLGAKSIVVDYKFPLIGDEVGGSGGFFQGAGWFYLLAIPFIIFQGNPYGQLFLTFCIGLLTVFFAYHIFSIRFGKVAGFCIGFLIAISPSISIQSRFAWPPFVIPFLTIFYIDALYGVFQGSRRSWFFLFFLLGLMTHFEIATALTLGIITCIILLVTNQFRLRHLKLSFIGLLIPMIPMLIFDVRHNFLNIRGLFAMATSAKEPYTQTFQKLFTDHSTVFSVNLFGTLPNIQFRFLFVLICLCILGIIFFDKKIKKEFKLLMVSLISLPCILFILLLLYKGILWEWWLLELPIFLYIIYRIGLFIFI